jgi:hypothetical protein
MRARAMGPAVGLIVTLLLAAGPAAATTSIPFCKEQIELLKAQTVAAPFKNQKDEDGLVAKLKEASLKLDVAKLGDASQKVGDYQTRLGQLNAQGKIDDKTGQTYSELSNGATAVQQCIGSIGK